MTWDYIVIGAGSAGCALASELADRRPEKRLLLLEAGGRDRSLFIRIPAGQIRAVARHDWGYRSQPDPSRNARAEHWPRGRVLGGCSSINGTMYVRGAAVDFDRWARSCGHAGGWSAAQVLPIFRDLETADHGSAFRGRNGPLHVRTVRKPHPVTRAFIEAAGACGYALNEDYNGEAQEGVGYAQLSQRRGMRCSAADAFARALARMPNVRIELGAVVEKIDMKAARAVSVRFSRGGNVYKECARDVILCAGAINSPRLLMLSGIGDPEELRRHGIDVTVALPGVGRNLREHPLLKLVYRTKSPTWNLTAGLLQKLRIAWLFALHGEGPVSNLFEAAAFLRSSPSEPVPDIQLHFMPIGCSTDEDGGVQFANFPSVTVLLNKSYPQSAGRVRLASRDPADAPRIECRLLEREDDVETMVRGIGVVRRIMAADPIAELVCEEIAPGPSLASDAALAEYVRARAGIAFHPAGTCRMGVDGDAVVTPELRVRGTENLWIADASVMPDLVSGNTNAVCMMIGMKLGRQLSAGGTSSNV